MTRNIGQTDRLIRIIIGVVLIVLAQFTAVLSSISWLPLVATIIGAAMLATAALGWCPPYALLGVNTCKTS